MDELLLSKVRLGIVAALLASEWTSFGALAETTQTTGGNLGAHLAKLVDAGYVEEEKLFVARRPQSRYRLSARGRKAFLEHVAQLQSLVKGAS
ncbi:MAG TPA: transcriptional regulator [Candidatus Dormibacteraeota bacterium]|nr:transcriptional regulator [Candidatus Dormibacteraeota bacterium]